MSACLIALRTCSAVGSRILMFLMMMMRLKSDRMRSMMGVVGPMWKYCCCDFGMKLAK